MIENIEILVFILIPHFQALLLTYTTCLNYVYGMKTDGSLSFDDSEFLSCIKLLLLLQFVQ